MEQMLKGIFKTFLLFFMNSNCTSIYPLKIVLSDYTNLKKWLFTETGNKTVARDKTVLLKKFPCFEECTQEVLPRDLQIDLTNPPKKR